MLKIKNSNDRLMGDHGEQSGSAIQVILKDSEKFYSGHFCRLRTVRKYRFCNNFGGVINFIINAARSSSSIAISASERFTRFMLNGKHD